MRIGYLYSRYPVFSQTFCDSEMLALEAREGVELVVGSINPPPSMFRHERFRELRAEVVYGAPGRVMKARMEKAEADGGEGWEALKAMAEDHEARYGESFKAWVRARNAVYFAQEFRKRGVEHVHVHFTNRATHTALFMKAYVGMPFSVTAHAQDFMVDLGSDELLCELCREASFVAAVSDFSAGLLRGKCPESAGKVTRVYNGLEPDDFPKREHPGGVAAPFRIVSVGRLIEFKGFHHLIRACGELRDGGVDVECVIVGEGEWRERLEGLVAELGLGGVVSLPGVKTQEEIKGELARSDVFALPCVVDGKGASDILPTVITEAMAAGLPVVSTRLVGVPEMVVDGETGLLVEPGDEGALAGALRRLALDGGERKRFGEAGVERARAVFELGKTSGQLLELMGGAVKADHSESEPREKATVLCLVDEWPGDEYSLLNSEVAWLVQDKRFRVVAMGAAERLKWWEDRPVEAALEGIEFLPDELVLDAEWEMSGEGGERGSDVERRALHLAAVIAKEGIRHVHACRGSMGKTAQLVAERAGVTYSVGVESGSGVGAGELREICSGAEPKEWGLDLRMPTRRRRIKIGSLKLRWPPTRWEEPDRTALYEEWYGQLAGDH
ncbi:MAG: glycosyltransferase family 4 protein [Verrucomicrobiota bacterium]